MENLTERCSHLSLNYNPTAQEKDELMKFVTNAKKVFEEKNPLAMDPSGNEVVQYKLQMQKFIRRSAVEFIKYQLRSRYETAMQDSFNEVMRRLEPNNIGLHILSNKLIEYQLKHASRFIKNNIHLEKLKSILENAVSSLNFDQLQLQQMNLKQFEELQFNIIGMLHNIIVQYFNQLLLLLLQPTPTLSEEDMGILQTEYPPRKKQHLIDESNTESSNAMTEDSFVNLTRMESTSTMDRNYDMNNDRNEEYRMCPNDMAGTASQRVWDNYNGSNNSTNIDHCMSLPWDCMDMFRCLSGSSSPALSSVFSTSSSLSTMSSSSGEEESRDRFHHFHLPDLNGTMDLPAPPSSSPRNTFPNGSDHVLHPHLVDEDGVMITALDHDDTTDETSSQDRSPEIHYVLENTFGLAFEMTTWNEHEVNFDNIN